MTEPRIRPRDPHEVSGNTRNIFDTYLRERGNIPNMFRTAIEYAELVTESGHAVDRHTYHRLAGYWTEGEIVEITFVAGLFAYFNRFNDALRVEVTT